MKKLVTMRGKKADTIALETTIFFILNIVFFVVMMIFVWKSSSGAVIYEQTYAKQIALLLDNAKPDMIIVLDIGKGIEIAKKNNVKTEDIVKINKEENKVTVALTGKGGYSFEYFSDYSVEESFSGNYFTMKIRENE